MFNCITIECSSTSFWRQWANLNLQPWMITSLSLQGFILISFYPYKKNGLLTGCPRNFDSIFDLIITQLGRWCQLGFVRLKITIGHIGDSFPWRKQCILLATVIVLVIHSFLYIGRGRNRWMAVDGIEWCLWIEKPCKTNNAPNKHCPDGQCLYSVWHCNKCMLWPKCLNMIWLSV